jgi:hypothetical protein
MGMLEGLEPIKAISSCKTRTILEGLEKDDRKILEVALADQDKWSNGALSRALAERGIKSKPKLCGFTDKGQCSCSKIRTCTQG